jgi:hypothetical protein
MHLLSEAEQMAVRRDMLNEIDWEYAAWLGSGGALGAAPWAVDMFREWLVKLGYDQAKTASAEEIIKKIAEIEDENKIIAAQNAADELAVNQDNARITQQNADAERRWKARGRQGPRPTPTDPKPLPTPKPLTVVPEMPKNVPKPPGFLGRVATKALTKVARYPIIASIVGTAGAAGVYSLIYYKAATGAMDTADEKVKEWVAKNRSRYEMFKEAAKMTDDWFAGLVQIDPGRLLRYFKIEMDYCSAFPDEPTCQKRMEKICADPGIRALNNGVPLDGCDPRM